MPQPPSGGKEVLRIHAAQMLKHRMLSFILGVAMVKVTGIEHDLCCPTYAIKGSKAASAVEACHEHASAQPMLEITPEASDSSAAPGWVWASPHQLDWQHMCCQAPAI